MITRSRRAALKSSSTTPFDSSPSTSKQYNNINNDDNDNNADISINPGDSDVNYINSSNIDTYRNNNNLRRSSRKITAITNEKIAGSLQNRLQYHQQHPHHHQQQQQQHSPHLLDPKSNAIEDIVKDVIGNIVDYVVKPSLNDNPSLRYNSTSNESNKSDRLSSDFLHCNENANFSLSQPSSSSSRLGCEEFINESGIEAITCEVALDVDMTQDSGRCPVCGLYGTLGFEGNVGDRLGKVCSKNCVDKLKINDKACICASCNKQIASDSQGYLANFGLTRSALCSEECLLKFEKENEPVQQCYSCKKDIVMKEEDQNESQSIFYWQTMEFCSPECIEDLQKSWGKKCANCLGLVPQQSLGKYSVRFGNVIKQFCHGSCLEQYKKAVKVCAYCQVKLSGCIATCTSITGGSSSKRIREFCDPICRSHYLQMIATRNSSTTSNNGEGAFSSPAVECCQCSRMVEKSSCLDVIFRGRKFLICSTFCLSAFKFSFDVTKIICESCSKYGWSFKSTNILHYSGFTKLFCSRKCLQMHVLKIRRIQSCLTCNVKKYNFDLVEKYNSFSGDSKLFCSTFCYATFEHYESQNIGTQTKAFCDWCKKLSTLSYNIPSPEKSVRSFCTYTCVLAHQKHESRGGGQFGFDNMLHLRSNQPLTASKSTTNSSFSDSVFKQPESSSDLRSSFSSPSIPAPSPLASEMNDFQRPYPSGSNLLDESSTYVSSLSTAASTNNDDNDLNLQSTIPSSFLNNRLNDSSCSSLGLSSSQSLENSSSNFVDKSTMWALSRRSKATLYQPIKRDRQTQTDIFKTNVDSNGKPVKLIPIPIFVPVLVPVPIPIPMGSASLIPLPLPTPIPFGFPIDPRRTSDNSLTNEEKEEFDDQVKDDMKQQHQSSPLPSSPSSASASQPHPNTTLEKIQTSDSKEISHTKPKSTNELQVNCDDSDIKNPTSASESKSNVKLKRSAQEHTSCEDTKTQGNNINADNCDSDTCSNTSDDQEKTKRRRVTTISTHG